jgi:tetratricopeptide (TPR) repeat protein
VQIRRPGLDAVPPGSFRDLVDALHDLYVSAGCPPVRAVSDSIFKNRLLESVSHETFRNALRGTHVLAWPRYYSIIIDLNERTQPPRDHDSLRAQFHALWSRAYEDQHIAPRVPEQRAEAGPPPAVVPPAVKLPDRNEHFTGRRVAVSRIRGAFDRHRSATIVLHGVNGAGKTHLAIEYAHRYCDEYMVAWWVPCHAVDQARTALVDLAEQLNIGVGLNTDRTITMLINHLSTSEAPYLLIFDGVEDESILGLIPAVGGHVILTTSDRELAYDGTMIEVEVLDFQTDEARDFLIRRVPDISEAQAVEVIDLLGRLPLALDQIADMHTASGLDWPQLLATYRDLGDIATVPWSTSRVVTNLRMARERLAASDPTAALVCDLFAWFAPAPVPISLLLLGRNAEPWTLQSTLTNTFQLRRALRELSNYGLIWLDGETQRVEMKPLYRRALREIMSSEAHERARRNVHEILTAARPGRPDTAIAKAYREIASHVLPAQLTSSRDPDTQHLIINLIRFYVLDGDPDAAARLADAAVGAWQAPDFLDADHERVLWATVEWSGALRDLGQYPRARQLTTAVMTRLQADPAYGPDNELTIAATTGAAADMVIDGQYIEAVTTNRGNLDRSVQLLGDHDARSADCRHQLATSLRHAGAYAEAADLDRPDFQRLHTEHGNNHARTVRAAFSLAEDLYGLGQFQQALDLVAEYAAAGRAVLGADDAAVVLASRTAGSAKRRLGHIDAALIDLAGLYHRCLDTFEPHDRYLLAVTVSYGNALRQSGDAARAESLTSDAIGRYQRIFNTRHPLSLAVEVNLAAIQRARGRWAAARDTGIHAAEQLRQTIGERHPFTVIAAINHATDLSLAGEHSGALQASERAFKIATDVRGPLHPDTLAAGANLALDLRAAGSRDDDLRERMLADWRALMGEAHPTVVDVARGIRVECDIEPLAI